ncbi:PQQ-dependent sugar dehydrogenase, partial [Crocosphaera watsonii]
MKLINFKLFYLAIFKSLIVLGIGGCFSPLNSSNNQSLEPTISQSSQASPSQQNITQVILTEGLENPWGMDWLPNGDILVTERPGRLRII